MKNAILIALFFVFTLTAFAADGKPVSYKSGDETVKGTLYSPAGKGPFPALVVIHEWWGLNDWVKEQASKLADQGYVTLAIDLYRGKVATTAEEAHEIMRGVPDDRATRDLHSAVEFLKSQSDVNKDRIGAIGWCMSQHTGQDGEKVRADMDRDYFMTSEEAKEYGIIDRVITHR